MTTVLFNRKLNSNHCRSFNNLSSGELNVLLVKCPFVVSLLNTKLRIPLGSRLSWAHEVPRRSRQKSSKVKRLIARSLYSTFVESFKSPAQRSGNSCCRTMQLAREEDLKSTDSVCAPCETISYDTTTKCIVTARVEDQTESTPTFDNDAFDSARTEPLLIVNQDNSCPTMIADIGYSLDTKKQLHWGAPSMSLSIGSSIGGRTSRYTMNALGPSTTGPAKVEGVAGVFMVLTVAALGITRALFNHSQVPQKLCSNCNGGGVERCDICNGCGEIKWEGKLQHSDPCPLCFGSCVRKCSVCCGRRFER
ncbi:hypothetical protein O6H91_05G055300 [Diphasiastrum complanatum]|uniref:Uncharacterized protein n=3 Tax=Diphasiastrum complanatum TaxID=34168 RepID=A0ACC2DNB3_DIPCM|nr:hypothetical protein O6H91_05G055300 [Diphasiastrum complanatum]KAJ7555794.1 hypothetical protein O6H91_05G055300 [Diphasiastrum complanatum]KAJ7555795.1 hypothetical protein O6H91_05G055300 [Diphasiastrum complanatum]